MKNNPKIVRSERKPAMKCTIQIGKRPQLGSVMRNILVRAISMLGVVALILTLSSQPAHSSILTPTIYRSPIDRVNDAELYGAASKLNSPEDVAYILSINDGVSKSVPFNSKSVITINLNRAIPEDISVQLSVYSGPDLIAFDQGGVKTNTTAKDVQYKNSTRYENATTSYTIEYPANTFGDQMVHFHSQNSAGHAEIVAKVINKQASDITVDDSTAYISVDIYRNWNLNVLIQIVGWIYFFAWSISFYFQFLLNYKRKSVVGLNFDFLAFNLLGFTCYSIYNVTLLFSYAVQQEYYKRYTYSRIPVEYNDLFFALHAVVITILTVLQCFIYERGEQQISLPAGIFLAVSSTVGFGLFIASLFNGLSILDVVLYLSYVKLVITVVKYVPQAYMNYKRKATTGWSIHNIILDFTGGSFSLMQMLLIAYNYNDWISIFGNFTKFGLGLVSMIFDVLFLVQHYVLYRSDQRLVIDDLENSSDSVPSPVISQSIRSANLSQQQQQPQEDSDEATEREE